MSAVGIIGVLWAIYLVLAKVAIAIYLNLILSSIGHRLGQSHNYIFNLT